MAPRYQPGQKVRVRDDYPIGHIRTPVYIRGKSGNIEKYLGDFGNPETLAYSLPSVKRPLYKVRFEQASLWPAYKGGSKDTLELDIYEHWLEKD
ncbi:MAG: SH3-like domain-containing protein [Beijerinckiaceae bacterium]